MDADGYKHDAVDRRGRAKGSRKADMDGVAEIVVKDAMDCIQSADLAALWSVIPQIALLDIPIRMQIRSAAKKAFKADLLVADWDAEIRKHAQDRFTLPDDHKRKIKVGGRQYDALIGDCIAALQESNEPPVLFWRQGQIVHIRRHENGRLEIRGADEDFILLRLARVAHFYREAEKGEVSTEPTRGTAGSILALDTREIQLPSLRGVTEVPIFREDGTIHSEPGYDAGSQMYYQPSIEFPEVPDQVTQDDAEAARDLILDVINEFPFDGEPSKANAVAMLLLPVIRPLINGPTPLACIVAPQAGTGKTKLASICAILATGFNHVLPWKREERENEVTISAAMFAQQPVMILDNVVGVLGSGVLCSALTSENFQGRIMGSSNMFNVPVVCAWIATANNLRLGDDMDRRVYTIRMDAKSAKPMLREDFKHPRLLEYVSENRGRLVHALLIMTRYWFCLGRPRAKNVVPLGSFESWHVVMASILETCGVEGFMGNIQETLGKDEYSEQWTVLMEAMFDSFEGEKFMVQDVVSRCLDSQYSMKEALPPWIPYDNTGKLRQMLGQQFHNRQGTRFGEDELYLSKAGRTRGKVQSWVIERGSQRGIANG
jgi:hypothetical protein